MAHIANCLADSDLEELPVSLYYIPKALSPQNSDESLGRASPSGEKPFAWRMQQPERKYQLFPRDRQAGAATGKALDPGQAFAHALGQNGEKGEKATVGTGLRIRIKEHNLIRRRKISVPDLGPMTTVQEVAMDSPTIPGRPPVHERSISAPGNSWEPHNLADYSSPAKPLNEARQPLSPKSLTPLVIPPTNSAVPRLTRQMSLTRLRSCGTPVEAPIRSARTDDSPHSRTPFTPLSAALTTPRSAATSAMTASTLPTPVSAPIETRQSPKPWERPANYAVPDTPKDCSPEPSVSPMSEDNEPTPGVALGHRRHQSESGSIMERGRPRKRSDVVGASPSRRAESKRSKSSERRAFVQLPKGWKATEVVNMLSQSEVVELQKQALQQAARFEVLRKEDVDNLSRELRQLDERTEYLRRTYTSLRAGRRNLHTRICQYLRSPRTAKFSPDSMLKQEEALAELDASIDEWVNKLEQAENRRTRVRQKLLEHVAAAATLTPPVGGGVIGVSETLQQAMGTRPLNAGNISTPPRSPTKTAFNQIHSSASPSPQRVVAQVPSTIIEQPLFEEAASTDGKEAEPATSLRRAETIRVYADNDVYTLLADVENAINKMGGRESPAKEEFGPEMERKKLHRAMSHDVLRGLPPRKPVPISKLEEKQSCSSLCSAPASTPPAANNSTEEIYLTSAVFKPE